MIEPRKTDLAHYWPPVVGVSEEFKQIAIAQNPEFDGTWKELAALERELNVVDAEDIGLRRWEQILEMPPKPNYTVEDRRFLILLRLNENIPYTERYLRGLFDGLIGKSNYVMTVLYGQYALDLKLRVAKNYLVEEIRNTLRRILPANIEPTVRSWFNQHFEFRQYAYGEMKSWTHQQMRETLDSGYAISDPLKSRKQFEPRKFTHAELAAYRNGGN